MERGPFMEWILLIVLMRSWDLFKQAIILIREVNAGARKDAVTILNKVNSGLNVKSPVSVIFGLTTIPCRLMSHAETIIVLK